MTAIAVLEFENNLLGLGILYMVVVQARQGTQAGGIYSLESIPGILKN